MAWEMALPGRSGAPASRALDNGVPQPLTEEIHRIEDEPPAGGDRGLLIFRFFDIFLYFFKPI